MASLLIRNLDDALKTRLRVRAARKGRSMEAEVREILKRELRKPALVKSAPTPKQRVTRPAGNLAELAREIFGDKGVDLEIPARSVEREPPDFSKW